MFDPWDNGPEIRAIFILCSIALLSAWAGIVGLVAWVLWGWIT